LRHCEYPDIVSAIATKSSTYTQKNTTQKAQRITGERTKTFAAASTAPILQ
jgi:hypothetical protein